MPDIEKILDGDLKPEFPEELSAKYALSCALALRSKTDKQITNALKFLAQKGTSEWLNQCAIDIFSILKEKNRSHELIKVLQSQKELLEASRQIAKLLVA